MLDRLGFTPDYEAALVEFAASGEAPAHEYRCAAAHLNHGPWIHVRVAPHGGAPWVGAFEMFDESGSSLYGMPSPDGLLVVSGGAAYVVSAGAPESWQRAPVLPVCGVQRVEGQPIIVLFDHQDLAAYGPDGLLWRISQLGQDELQVEAASEAGIAGTVWCGGAPGTGHVRFRVEPWTGAILEGPRPLRGGEGGS